MKFTEKQKILAVRLIIEHGADVVSACSICGKIAHDHDWPDIAKRCRRKRCTEVDAKTLNLDAIA